MTDHPHDNIDHANLEDQDWTDKVFVTGAVHAQIEDLNPDEAIEVLTDVIKDIRNLKREFGDQAPRLAAALRMVERSKLIAGEKGPSGQWPDHQKVRLVSLLLDKRDFDEGVYDHTDVQDDLWRIAERIETLATNGWWS